MRASAVIDIASRRVVGYAMAEHLRTKLICDALANAIAAREPAPGVIFHSDRGQYTSGTSPPASAATKNSYASSAAIRRQHPNKRSHINRPTQNAKIIGRLMLASTAP